MPRSQMEQLHRHLIRFIAVDTVFVALIILSLLSTWSGPVKVFTLILGVVLVPLGVLTTYMLHKRTEYGYNLGIYSLSLFGSAFLLLGLIVVSDSMSAGGIWFLQGILFLLLGVSALRRVPTMRNPAYIQWYEGTSWGGKFQSSTVDREVLATCPACSSILAIYPNKMTSSDRCPNCNSNLVSMEEEWSEAFQCYCYPHSATNAHSSNGSIGSCSW